MADTKNWTWVLERPCPDCGFDAQQLARDQIGATTRAAVRTLAAELDDPVAARQRPAPEVWSSLEYGCHAVDVARIFVVRLGLIRTEVDPTFPNWDQDETAIVRRYDEQVPAEVAVELVVAGDELADDFDDVGDDEWDRRGFRSEGSVFTIESLGRYMVHDLVHHVWDLTSVRGDQGSVTPSGR